MKPFKDKIFAVKIVEEQKTQNGIILPEQTKQSNLYKVVAIGDKVQHIKVGDTVKKYNGAVCPTIEYNEQLVEVLVENGHIEFIM